LKSPVGGRDGTECDLIAHGCFLAVRFGDT
jgi:hypothetical protein